MIYLVYEYGVKNRFHVHIGVVISLVIMHIGVIISLVVVR